MATKKVATPSAEVAPVAKKTCKRTACKKVVEVSYNPFNAENVGFKAGDVYQALAAAQMPLSIKEIAKNANISAEETLLGMGWLFKEGKIAPEADKVRLA